MANNLVLPKGFKLNEYVISKKLSSGGFSVVYLAYDKHGQPVAIKEFFPNHLHLRSKGTRIDLYIPLTPVYDNLATTIYVSRSPSEEMYVYLL